MAGTGRSSRRPRQGSESNRSTMYHVEKEEAMVSATVWREVSTWPARERLALATQLLHSLEVEETVVSEKRKDALLRLIGAWKVSNPPSDEEVERIREEELTKKYL